MVNLWSSPRNISTALMYSFAQRPDCRVVDEPLYAHYLLRQPTEAHHPGREKVLATQGHDGREVIANLFARERPGQTLVLKQMTHHLVELDLAWLDRCRNVLLIRRPEAILASYGKVVDKVTAEDVGLPQQYALYRHLTAAGKLDAVIDSERLLRDPAGVLQKLCARLDLPWTEAMLSWEAAPRPEDGSWAEHWYGNVHQSTGFKPFVPRAYTLTLALAEIAAAVEPAYLSILSSAL